MAAGGWRFGSRSARCGRGGAGMSAPLQGPERAASSRMHSWRPAAVKPVAVLLAAVLLLCSMGAAAGQPGVTPAANGVVATLPPPPRVAVQDAPLPSAPPPQPPLRLRGLRSWQDSLAAHKQRWRQQLAARPSQPPPAADGAETGVSATHQDWRSQQAARKSRWRKSLHAEAAADAEAAVASVHLDAASQQPQTQAANSSELAAAAGASSCPSDSSAVGVMKLRLVGRQAQDPSDPALQAALRQCIASAATQISQSSVEVVTTISAPVSAPTYNLTGSHCQGGHDVLSFTVAVYMFDLATFRQNASCLVQQRDLPILPRHRDEAAPLLHTGPAARGVTAQRRLLLQSRCGGSASSGLLLSDDSPAAAGSAPCHQQPRSRRLLADTPPLPPGQAAAPAASGISPPAPPSADLPPNAAALVAAAASGPTDFSLFAALDANMTLCADAETDPFSLEVPEYLLQALLGDCLSNAGYNVSALCQACLTACDLQRPVQMSSSMADCTPPLPLHRGLSAIRDLFTRLPCSRQRLSLSQFKVLQQSFTALPAAENYTLSASSSAFREAHGFVLSLGVSGCSALHAGVMSWYMFRPSARPAASAAVADKHVEVFQRVKRGDPRAVLESAVSSAPQLQGGLAVAPVLDQQTAMLSVLTDQLAPSVTGLAWLQWLNLTWCPVTRENTFNVGIVSVGTSAALMQVCTWRTSSHLSPSFARFLFSLFVVCSLR